MSTDLKVNSEHNKGNSNKTRVTIPPPKMEPQSQTLVCMEQDPTRVQETPWGESTLSAVGRQDRKTTAQEGISESQEAEMSRKTSRGDVLNGVSLILTCGITISSYLNYDFRKMMSK